MATGASRFTRRYTDQQKDALLRAVCIDRMTVAAAVRAAEAGELGIPAYTVNRLYAYSLIKDGRDQFEAGNEQALAVAIEHELKGAEIDALANIRAIRRALKAGEGDTAKLAQATRDLATITRARRETSKTPKGKTTLVQTNGTEPQNTDNGNTLQGLLGIATQSAPKTTQQSEKTGSLGRSSSAG
jgi:hypothetical protein